MTAIQHEEIYLAMTSQCRMAYGACKRIFGVLDCGHEEFTRPEYVLEQLARLLRAAGRASSLCRTLCDSQNGSLQREQFDAALAREDVRQSQLAADRLESADNELDLAHLLDPSNWQESQGFLDIAGFLCPKCKMYLIESARLVKVGARQHQCEHCGEQLTLSTFTTDGRLIFSTMGAPGKKVVP